MSEGERRRSRSPVVGASSPGSREATGEGGEGFISPEAAGAPIYTHQRGRAELEDEGHCLSCSGGEAWVTSLCQECL